MTIEWSDWDTAGSDDKPSGRSTSGGVDARERHKLAERERRKSMRELFLSLHALLPHANTVRKEQSAILDEIIKYIPLAAARLRSLQNRMDSSSSSAAPMSSPDVQVSDRSSAASNSTDCDIRVAPEPSSSVSIRIRGDRVNVSLSDSKTTSQALSLSAVLDELEVHHLELIRSTYCCDGSKTINYSESKVCDGLDRSPTLLKARLQELACKLQKLRKSSPRKRSFDQLD
ncbi:PREDICTED: uncharacterized protein LOC104590951 [Nelumbo nucifera]|uniref:Uncharacterized protein LOC104590951 n=2 Tax=Nelumbo nucifera TaxID=4432 RepID=A0A1U7ZJP8_NELNU|nr:PREDICTED: uncharacterized protein LOC104590951 [Nelumbo nucifera]DAD29664.1 TPA_asm: hypothetical protein HUJ06_031132 [Nelumbo nucifera]